MSDELLTGLLPGPGLRVLLASTTGLCRKGRDLHQCHPAAATLFAQGMTAGLLLASLQKEDSRVNLQLECDGPLRGMFVDANSRGSVRGYVKNPNVEFTGAPGQFAYRPVLGNSGFLSVLRDRGQGDFYRSAVELKTFDIAADLENYFDQSEQIRTPVFLEAVAQGEEPLFCVGGMLLQSLPDGDRVALESWSKRLREEGGFSTVVRKAPSAGIESWAEALFPGEVWAPMVRGPLSYQCHCSRQRVLDALASIGQADLQDILDKDGKAEMTCEFCMTRYDITGAELRQLLGGVAQA
jgi:molecular chaperone Hsp33